MTEQGVSVCYTPHMSALPSLLGQELVGIIRFPVWWYGAGFSSVLKWMREDLRLEWGRLGVRLWMRSWLRPMYGASDLIGRLISVVMRTVVILGRSVWWLILASIYALGAFAWLAWPVLAVILLLLPLLW